MRKIGGIPISSLVGVGCLLAAFALVVVLFRFFPGEQAKVVKTEPVQAGPGEGMAVSGAEIPAGDGATAPKRYLRMGNILDVSREPSMAGLEATKISVDFEEQYVTKAFEAFSMAAGVAVEAGPALLNRPELPPMSLHLKDEPLMEGVLRLMDQAAVTSIMEWSPLKIVINSNRPFTAYGKWCVSGPFALVMRRGTRAVSFGDAPPGAGRGMLHFELLAEPRYRVTSVSTGLAVETMVDEKGRTIATEVLQGTTTTGQVTVRYMVPENAADAGERIARLRGSANVTLALSRSRLDVTLGAETVLRELGGLKVEVLPVVRGGAVTPTPRANNTDSFVVRIRYQRMDMPPDMWSAIKPLLTDFATRPKIFGQGDRTLTVMNGKASNEDPEVLTATFEVRSPANVEPQHLVFDIPTEIREVRVPFEFRDLILP